MASKTRYNDDSAGGVLTSCSDLPNIPSFLKELRYRAAEIIVAH